MNKKIPLSQEEKVAAILKKVKNVGVSGAVTPVNDMSAKCSRCKKQLSPLEKVIFFDKCVICARYSASAAKEKFLKKYIGIFVSFVVLVLASSFMKYYESVRVAGLVFQAITIGSATFYVAYDVLPLVNSDKMTPKVRLMIASGFALGVSMIMMVIEISAGLKAAYFVFVAAVIAYLAYSAYKASEDMKQQFRLLEVYDRKSRDEKYLEELNAAIDNRADANDAADRTTEETDGAVKECSFIADARQAAEENENKTPAETSGEKEKIAETSENETAQSEKTEIGGAEAAKPDGGKTDCGGMSDSDGTDDGCWII